MAAIRRRPRASRCAVACAAAATFSMATCEKRLTTFDTVRTETPASAATSFRLTPVLLVPGAATTTCAGFATLQHCTATTAIRRRRMQEGHGDHHREPFEPRSGHRS